MQNISFGLNKKSCLRILVVAMISTSFSIQSYSHEVEHHVVQKQKSVESKYNLGDIHEFENAKKGFIAKPEGQILNANKDVVWDFSAFDFIEGEAPPSVNPSLWRQAKLNNNIGLYQVADKIW